MSARLDRAPRCLDANGDGLLDIYIPNGNWLRRPPKAISSTQGEDRPRNALYIQQSDGTFRERGAGTRRRTTTRGAFGSCAADLDNDGDQDLLVSNLGANCLFVNDGKGHFKDIAAAAGIAGRKVDWSTGIACGDYDRDGRLDIYIANYADLFEWMRKQTDIIRGKDGEILDAAICNWNGLKVYCGPKGLPGQQDYLFRSVSGVDGEMRFEDVTKAAGIWRSDDATGPLYGFQVLFTDVNKDGWPDLYIANDSVPSFFFENVKGKFREMAQHYNVAIGDMGDDMAGMGATSADVNGDGWPDLHKTNFSQQTNNLYICEPYEVDGKTRISFRDYSAQTGIKQEVYPDLGWGVQVFDYDNDGDRDIFYANGHVYPEVDSGGDASKLNTSFDQVNKMLRNDTEGDRLRFTPVTGILGPGMAVQRGSRGASLIDLGNDGDLDLVIVNLNATPDILVNQRGAESGAWVQLRLEGNVAKNTNRDAIGSHVWVRSKNHKQFFETKRGQGFLGCNDPRIHVGLGKDDGPIDVEIKWPNGDTSKHTIESVRKVVTIKQP